MMGEPSIFKMKRKAGRWEKLKKVPQMAMGRVQRKLNF
jgi:hypothetical protein